MRAPVGPGVHRTRAQGHAARGPCAPSRRRLEGRRVDARDELQGLEGFYRVRAPRHARAYTEPEPDTRPDCGSIVVVESLHDTLALALLEDLALDEQRCRNRRWWRNTIEHAHDARAFVRARTGAVRGACPAAAQVCAGDCRRGWRARPPGEQTAQRRNCGRLRARAVRRYASTRTSVARRMSRGPVHRVGCGGDRAERGRRAGCCGRTVTVRRG